MQKYTRDEVFPKKSTLKRMFEIGSIRNPVHTHPELKGLEVWEYDVLAKHLVKEYEMMAKIFNNPD